MKMLMLCDRYLNEYAIHKKTYANDKWMIDTHVRNNKALPKMVEAVEYEHVEKLVRAFKKTPYLGNRVRSLLSTMFNLAELWKIRPQGSNPCTHVKRFQEQKRHRYLTDDELKSFIVSCETLFAERPKPVGLLLLLLYTGARCSEVKRGERAKIIGTEWHLADSKRGQGIIFLTPQALAVIDRLSKVYVSHPYVIGPHINPRYAFASICKMAGINDFRIHDLRHCFASLGISVNLTLAKIGPLLRHSSTETTKRYAHLVPSEGRAAALAIGGKFESLTA